MKKEFLLFQNIVVLIGVRMAFRFQEKAKPVFNLVKNKTEKKKEGNHIPGS